MRKRAVHYPRRGQDGWSAMHPIWVMIVALGLLLMACSPAEEPLDDEQTEGVDDSDGRDEDALGGEPDADAADEEMSPEADELVPVSMVLSWIGTTPNQMPFYLALARGYYEDEGLDLTLDSGRGSALAAQQVAAGEYDIAQADLTVMALTRGEGAALTAVMVQIPRTSFGVVASPEAGIEDWADLYGKTLAVTAGAPETFLLPATFRRLGLDIDEVEQVNTPPPNKISNYVSGQVDALATDVASDWPMIVSQRDANDLWFGDVLEVPYHGVFARDDFIEENPAVVEGVVKATARAIDAMLQDPETVREAAEAQLSANPEHDIGAEVFMESWSLYEEFLTSPLTEGQPTGWMSEEAWATTLQILADYAGFEGSLNPTEYFTNDFVEN